MSKNRRKLKVHERARSDQFTAAARNWGATEPTTAVFTLEFADSGTGRCCWCDCPDTPDSPHYQPGYQCGGCPRDAMYVLHAMHGSPHQQDYPVCAEHRDNMATNVARVTKAEHGCVPRAVISVPVLDADSSI